MGHHQRYHKKSAISERPPETLPRQLYKESKPEGANDLKNFQDENGKYTTEGAAAAVRPSIVEIYTYTNSSKSVLYGTGSGIVISEDGYIVTNAHVLQENGCHDIKTLDGHTFGAKIIGRDAKTDIAVIKVTGVKLTPAVLGNSDEAIVGEQVIAIGNIGFPVFTLLTRIHRC